MKKITFEKAEREAIAAHIQRYMLDELEITIGNLPSQQLLQFFGEIVGPFYYNQGLHDAQAAFTRQLDTANDEIYGLEQREARAR